MHRTTCAIATSTLAVMVASTQAHAATYGDDIVYATGLPEHVDGTTPDPLLRTYRGVAEQLSTGTQNHLLLDDHWVEDTRIPPLGSLPNPETDPVGDRYELGDDGTWPNFDAFAYDFPGAPEIDDATPDDPTDDDLQVSVRLLYVINTAEYIEFLADANVTNEAGQQVADIFALMGGAPAMLLAEQSVTIPIGSFGPIAGTSTGAADTSGSASQGGSDSSDGPIDPSTTTDDPTNASASEASGDGGAAGEDAGGCGCRSTGAPFAGWSLVVIAALRRRRPARATRVP